MKSGKQRKGTEMGGQRTTSVGGQGRPAVQVTSDQITAGGEKVNCVKLTKGEHPSLGTTEDKDWEQSELGVRKEQEL